MLLRYSSLLCLLPLTAALPCTFCADGSGTDRPEYVVEGAFGYNLTCEFIISGTPLVVPDESHENCATARRFGSICGCPKDENACNLCRDGVSEIPFSQRHDIKVSPGDRLSLFCYTCECIQAYTHSFQMDSSGCTDIQTQYADFCGCPAYTADNNDSSFIPSNDTAPLIPTKDGSVFEEGLWLGYFGTKSVAGFYRLTTFTRVSALFSIVGAIAVISDSMISKVRRRHIYNQIVSAMAIVDIVYVLAVGLQAIPVPSGAGGAETGQERGNFVTCKVQGWLIQFSAMASLGFNCALSTYFYIAVVYRLKRTLLNQYRRWLFLCPIMVGVVLACVSYPMVIRDLRGCYLLPPVEQNIILVGMNEIQQSWMYFSFIYVIPAILGTLYITVTMVLLMFHIRKMNSRGSRWAFDSATNPGRSRNSRRRSITPTMRSLERQVALQCVLYLVSLYCTWITVSVLGWNFNGVIFKYYPLWMIVSICITAQGFFNSCIYFRPRICAAITKLISDCRETIDKQSGRNVAPSVNWASVLASSEPAVLLVEQCNEIEESNSHDDENGLVNLSESPDNDIELPTCRSDDNDSETF